MIQSYQNLIGIAKECFKTLLLELIENKKIQKSFHERVQHIIDIHDNIDYAESSFMNLFNYDYGHLGPHRDRCLVTVVYTYQPNSFNEKSVTDNAKKKNLWCLTPGQEESTLGNWTSIDKLVIAPDMKNSVCLHVGEEMSALYDNHIHAAMHCVLPDPTKPPEYEKEVICSNRLSAALILSAADISTIVDDMLQPSAVPASV